MRIDGLVYAAFGGPGVRDRGEAVGANARAARSETSMKGIDA